MGVIFIALLHALPVYLIARLTRNRWVLLIAAAVCAVVAAMFGGERYVVYDLLAIVIAMILAWPLTGVIPEDQVTGVASIAGTVLGKLLKYGTVIGVLVVAGALADKMYKEHNYKEQQQAERDALMTKPIVALRDHCEEHVRARETTPVRFVPGLSEQEVCGAYEHRMAPHAERYFALNTKYLGRNTPTHIRQQITADCEAHTRKAVEAREQDPAMEIVCTDFERSAAIHRARMARETLSNIRN